MLSNCDMLLCNAALDHCCWGKAAPDAKHCGEVARCSCGSDSQRADTQQSGMVNCFASAQPAAGAAAQPTVVTLFKMNRQQNQDPCKAIHFRFGSQCGL
jgi:hypothetical protein